MENKALPQKFNTSSCGKKIFLILIVIFFIIGCALLFICDYMVRSATSTYTYDSMKAIPKKDFGLLLGTSKRVKWNNRKNLFFSRRVAAAINLFHAGKIKRILISGDGYDKEPADMRKDLVAHGIPPNVIYLDPKGFRTYDSIINASKIFELKDFIIISQRFHNERAIYIAKCLGLNAIGYNAADVHGYYGLKVWRREKLARVKMICELYFGSRQIIH